MLISILEMAARFAAVVAVAFIPTLVFRRFQPGVTQQAGAALLGWIVFVIVALYEIYYFSPAVYDPATSLPLHVCDLLGFVAIFALLNGWRAARAILVIATVPFVSQAILTPVGNHHFFAVRTLVYWLLHTGIVAAFIFEVVVRRFRPRPSEFRLVVVVSVLYVGLISILNMIFNWNYGYIGNDRPDTPTLLDALGPWPERVAIVLLIAVVAQYFCYRIFRTLGRDDDL